jgi:hypothetical protein
LCGDSCCDVVLDAGELGELENLEEMLENHDDRLGDVPNEPLLSDDPERARRRGTGTGADPLFSGVPFATVAGVVVAVVVGVAGDTDPFVLGFDSLDRSESAGARLFCCDASVTLSMTLSLGTVLVIQLTSTPWTCSILAIENEKATRTVDSGQD